MCRLPKQHFRTFENIGIVTATIIDPQVIPVLPDTQFWIIGLFYNIERVLVPGSGGVIGRGNSHQHVVICMTKGELPNNPAVGLFIIEDGRVAVIIGGTGDAGKQGVQGGRACQKGSGLVINGIGHIDHLHIMVRACRSVAVGRI